jgi:hypothetical protein
MSDVCIRVNAFKIANPYVQIMFVINML